MGDFVFLMHGDYDRSRETPWPPYLRFLEAEGALRGGSAIGGGLCVRRLERAPEITAHLVGLVRIAARDIEHAKRLVVGNPVFEAGGTVEIRELPSTD